MTRTLLLIALGTILMTLGLTATSFAQYEDDGFSDYCAGWEANQATYDRLSESWSDYMLGYQDVYNPDTGEVVEADAGYTSYYSTDSSTLWESDSYSTPGGSTVWEPVD